jgi:hypothetical protein
MRSGLPGGAAAAPLPACRMPPSSRAAAAATVGVSGRAVVIPGAAAGVALVGTLCSLEREAPRAATAGQLAIAAGEPASGDIP